MEFEKVIFLDIDGPLATNDCFAITEFRFGVRIYKWNPKCVAVLNEIIKETNATIVLSSDWRKYFTTDELADIFKWNNVITTPEAVTDINKYQFSSSGEVDRIHQIGRFLENNSIKKWVAVDDLNLNSDIVTNLVLVEGEEGITANGVKEKIISYLI